MKTNIQYASICCLLIVLFACKSQKNSLSNNTALMQGKVKTEVIAHRGAWKSQNLPENSIASLKQAIKLNYAGSEFDIHMTADDSLVINHDPNFFDLPIEKSTYSQLTQHQLANGEPIPTLYNYLQVGAMGNGLIVAEIKPSAISKERGQIVAEKVLNLVQQMQLSNKVVFISFDIDILKKIVALMPNANTQYLEGDYSPQQIKQIGINGIDYHYKVFYEHPEWIKEAKQLGIKLNAWTVNNKKDMIWLIENGFDNITTNEPELLQQILTNK